MMRRKAMRLREVVKGLVWMLGRNFGWDTSEVLKRGESIGNGV